mmetsp:Transcript_150420/g.261333  ORF Transcript_150420/g.261333 Transcript_150420/m.261333 type:complete len:106 (-) Transcript_150420:131-448(-)
MLHHITQYSQGLLRLAAFLASVDCRVVAEDVGLQKLALHVLKENQGTCPCLALAEAADPVGVLLQGTVRAASLEDTAVSASTLSGVTCTARAGMFRVSTASLYLL